MTELKIGVRVNIIVGSFKNVFGTIVESKLTENSYKVKTDTGHVPMWYLERELVKTKTVKKYVVVADNGYNVASIIRDKLTETEVLELNQMNNGYTYHIVPTLFTEEKVHVKTETRYTFICKDSQGDYYATDSKYKNLDSAKSRTMKEAIQQIDSSAEEFEIE